MDTTLIYQALEQPALRKQIPIDELERIQAEYPYFTAAHVLLAKIYQENKDHRYADQLQQAALYAIDRKVLSEYMKENGEMGEWGNEEEPVRQAQGPPIRQAQGTEQNENQNENELRGEEPPVRQAQGPPVRQAQGTELNENDNQNENELRGEEPPVRQAQGPPVRQAQGTEQNENDNQNENELRGEELPIRQAQGPVQNENEFREEELELEQSPIVEMSDFDREILIEAVHSSIELEVGEEEEEDEEIELTDALEEGEDNLDEFDDEELARIAAKDPSELTFGEMMMLKAARMRANQKPPVRQAQGPPVRQAQGPEQNENDNQNENELRGPDQNENQNQNEFRGERTEERAKNFDYLYKLHNGGLPPIDAIDEKEKQKNLIDRFIKLEPKITPGKASEYNTASNLAKESLEEDFSFATETMAKLFIAQGKFDKAKKVYRKLMELHPEKNVYFAAQLKNLNQNKKQ